MKKLVVASIIAALSGAPAIAPKAEASDEVLAAIGGFIGGVVVGTAISPDSHHKHYRGSRCAQCAPRHRGHVNFDDGYHPTRGGHWKWVEVRVWVPGRWNHHFDRCGRGVRTWVPGGYEIRRERRWVATHGGRSHRHHG